MPRVGAGVVTGVRGRSSVGGQFEDQAPLGLWLGSTLRQSIMNSFPCEGFIIVYYVILKLTVFMLKLLTCVGRCTVRDNRVRCSLSPSGVFCEMVVADPRPVR